VMSTYSSVRNQLLLSSEYAPLAGWSGFRREIGAVAVHLARSRRSSRRSASVRALLHGWRDYRRGRFGAWAARGR